MGENYAIYLQKIWGYSAWAEEPPLWLDFGSVLQRIEPICTLEETSGRNSEEEDDGASVPVEEPTGYGATGMSVREEADGQ